MAPSVNTSSVSPGPMRAWATPNGTEGSMPTAGPVGARRARTPATPAMAGASCPPLTYASAPSAGSITPTNIVANMFALSWVRAM